MLQTSDMQLESATRKTNCGKWATR